ncbi:MAG: ABC transporter ATP-binding protein [Clostridiales Family XIII bacterium]|jgi:oligopeptide/dipeptide ABC transporter ATP-binding protein|nr:ABC transporter ATP-binding protein [Clostridiales Family XIII bacterium]
MDIRETLSARKTSSTNEEADKRLLHVKDLSVAFSGRDGWVSAVTGVSFDIAKGESVALVGESGCGKSVTAMSVLRLLDMSYAKVEAEELKFCGTDILSLSDRTMRSVRGNEISMIFQEPMTSLNPLFTVGFQIAESVRLHLGKSKRAAMQYAVEMLDRVGISDPKESVKSYPHQFSGGMRQRVMIAMAMACNPKLLIADEPTTALDVTIQAQILDLMREMRKTYDMSLLMITHNLGVVAEIADRAMVMYAGQIVEETTAAELFDAPMHPYTQGLVDSIPTMDLDAKRKLCVIKGTVPSPMFYSKACRFSPRCDRRRARCGEVAPQLDKVSDRHFVRCHFPFRAGVADDLDSAPVFRGEEIH